MPKLTFILILCSLLVSHLTQAADLEAGWMAPPVSARPHTWWHWMNGNISREGITADLEAMAKAGVGGAQIFNVSCDIPAGKIDYMSEEWLELL